MKATNDNLFRETITGNDTQTVIMDSALTAETDAYTDPHDDDEDDQEDDIGLNHDEDDDLSLNIQEDDDEY